MEINTKNLLYISSFWKNVTFEMLEDALELDGISLSEYIIEMWKFFYENSKTQFSLPAVLEKENLNYKITKI